MLFRSATTGGQPVPNAKNVHYDALARGAGYPNAHAFDNLESFAINVERILTEPGPVFVALKVTPEVNNTPIGQRKKWQTRKPVEALRDMQKELGIGG